MPVVVTILVLSGIPLAFIAGRGVFRSRTAISRRAPGWWFFILPSCGAALLILWDCLASSGSISPDTAGASGLCSVALFAMAAFQARLAPRLARGETFALSIISVLFALAPCLGFMVTDARRCSAGTLIGDGVRGLLLVAVPVATLGLGGWGTAAALFFIGQRTPAAGR